MEFVIILIVAIIALPLIALAIAASARSETKKLRDEVLLLHTRLRNLERTERVKESTAPAMIPERKVEQRPVATAPPTPTPRPTQTPPPIPATKATPRTVVKVAKQSPPPAPKKPLNWEAFMGGKLFAWIGGLALFLGLAFFVRYSFEQNLIPPAARVILGSLAGAGLLIGGWFVKRKTYEVTSQTLCATGILTLYACVFASSHAFYGFFNMPVAFVLMAAVTATAFTIAVRLNGQVVAILGLLGGFLTPVLLSTGNDHSVALFSYIAVLDIGLAAIAFKQRWRHLVVLAAIATVLMQAGWAISHFTAAKAFGAMGIFLGFQVLFLGVFWWNNRSTAKEKWALASALILSGSAMLVSLLFFSYAELAARPWIVLSYVIVVDVLLLAIPFFSSGCRRVVEAAAVSTFSILGLFILIFLQEHSFLATLPFFVIFGLIHSAAPILMRRLHPGDVCDSGHRILYQLAPLLTLLLALLPMVRGLHTFALLPTILILNVLLLIAAALSRSSVLSLGASLLAFLVMGAYTLGNQTDHEFRATLPFLVVFGFVQSGAPMLMRRLNPLPDDQASNLVKRLCQLTPLVTLVLVMLPMLRGFYGFSIWPTALLINVLLIAAAVQSRSAFVALGASLLTFLLAAFYIVTLPTAKSMGLNEVLVVVLGFGGFFSAAAVFLSNRLGDMKPIQIDGLAGHPSLAALAKPDVLLAVWSGVLPFALLVMSMGRLSHLQNPSPVFLAALVLGAMLTYIARRNNMTILATVAFGGVIVVEALWMQIHFSTDHPVVPLAWLLFFNAAFTGLPFILSGDARRTALPWATSALSGILHYFLIYGLIESTWSIELIGVVPALMAVPPLLILFHLIKEFPDATDPTRNRVLAWTGGAALFFITLIAPVQFDREWLTVAWALEGVALIWLFHHVPHVGLKATGVVLLAIAFARLTLNPFVFDYHARSGVPILNWYLWVYGLAAACHFGAGRLLQPPREKLFGRSVQPLAFGGGVILAFYLLNIQIADFYSTGSRVSFEFSANFARDMTYSIAWALFAFPLFVAGFWRKLPACRYAGLALMSFTLLKLFVHDLSQLNQLYRIGALVGVAVTVIAASVLYQKFAPTQKA
ncbi:MAG: DUF2339 domain-containing protein [Verrucomicrobiae bacterium]|nr:DUF2339 domain-containing protein [Verrucomicrobiae bacterium]